MKKQIMVAGVLAIAALGAVLLTSSSSGASEGESEVLLAGASSGASEGESEVLLAGASPSASEGEAAQAKAPRYSETCAHGRNGFNCKVSTIRADITDLQERVAVLEGRR